MMKAGRVFWSLLSRLWHETEGQDLIEYSLLLGFMAISALAVLSGIKSNMTFVWNKAGSTISSATVSAAS